MADVCTVYEYGVITTQLQNSREHLKIFNSIGSCLTCSYIECLCIIMVVYKVIIIVQFVNVQFTSEFLLYCVY